MTDSKTLWWEAEAWNSQTLDFFASGRVVDEGFLASFFQAKGCVYVPSKPQLQLPPTRFLTVAYAHLGTPTMTQQGTTAYIPEPWGVDEVTPFERWKHYYTSVGGKNTSTVQAETSDRDYFRRALNYLATTAWTTEETVQIVDVITRRQLGNRYPELHGKPWRKVNIILGEYNTKQYEVWQAFFRNPYLLGADAPEGIKTGVWDYLAAEIETDYPRLLKWLAVNPAASTESLKRWEIITEKRELRFLQKEETFRQIRAHPNLDPERRAEKVKAKLKRLQSFNTGKLTQSLRSPHFPVTSDWIDVALLCAEGNESEGFVRETLPAAYEGGNWKWLNWFAPMVGAVLAEREEAMGVEPGAVPIEWLMATV